MKRTSATMDNHAAGGFSSEIPPTFLAALFIVVLIVFSGTAVYQYLSRKEEIEHQMQEEARILIHALSNGTETALLGYNGNAEIVTGSLIDQLRLIERMDRYHGLTSRSLSELVGNSNIYRVTVFDRKGRRIAWNSPPDHQPIFQDCTPTLRLEPILSKKTDLLNLGLRHSPSNKIPRLVVAIARKRGGAIVGNVDATRLIDLRREIGPGRLIQQIGATESGIEYIIWQNRSSIISATPNITETESIMSDPVLADAFVRNRATSRFTTFNGKKVFEAISPFISNGTSMGIFRIGLKADHIDIATKRLLTRLLMLLGLAVAGAIAVFSLMRSRRNESLMAEAYRREQRFSSVILSNMGDAVITVDAERRITMVNAAAVRLLGLDAAELNGNPIETILQGCHPDLPQLLIRERQDASREFTCTVMGKKRILSGNFRPLIDSGLSHGGAVVVLRDMTEQRAMQLLLERQEKLTAMGELASGVAHEIRNPLNAIGVIGQRLTMEFVPAEGVEEYRQLTRAIVGEVYRVDGIIRQFLKFARPPRLNLVETEIDPWLYGYLPMLEGEAQTGGVQLVVDASSACSIPIDREQMQQALLNLVRNAVEATPPGGSVTVTCTRTPSGVAMEVRDSGRGIPDKEIAQIFNLYFTTKDNGTGMGLSIANQIVQAHGGTIQVESTEGCGSSFTIQLPCA